MPASETRHPVAGGSDVGGRARTALILSVGLTVALYFVPYGRILARPLLWLSTWAHELGHGVAAMLIGGRCDALNLYADGSGVAPWTDVGRAGHVAHAFVSAGGLCGPAVVAAVLFLLARRPRVARLGLFAFAAALLVSDLLLVRTVFGLVFVGAFGAVCLLLAVRASAATAQTVVAFLAVQLSLSVFSRGDYLFVATARTGAGDLPSDVAQMANHLGGPYFFWGAVCGAFSVLVLLVGVWLFLRASRSR